MDLEKNTFDILIFLHGYMQLSVLMVIAFSICRFVFLLSDSIFSILFSFIQLSKGEPSGHPLLTSPTITSIIFCCCCCCLFLSKIYNIKRNISFQISSFGGASTNRKLARKKIVLKVVEYPMRLELTSYGLQQSFLSRCSCIFRCFSTTQILTPTILFIHRNNTAIYIINNCKQ